MMSSRKSSRASREIVKIFSDHDVHSYWTIVMDDSTTAKDAVSSITDKLGESSVQNSKLRLFIKEEGSSPHEREILDDEKLIEAKFKWRKKEKTRFILKGLPIPNTTTVVTHTSLSPLRSTILINDSHSPHTNSNESTPTITPISSQSNTPIISSTPTSDNSNNNNNHNNNNHNTNTDNTHTNPDTNNNNNNNNNNTQKLPTISLEEPSPSYTTKSNGKKKNLTLIHVFYNNRIYWTLAVKEGSRVGDICRTLSEKLALKDARVILHEVEMDSGSLNQMAVPGQIPSEPVPDQRDGAQVFFKGLSANLNIRRLPDEMAMSEVIARWGPNSTNRFFIKEEKITNAASRVSTYRTLKRKPIVVCASETSSRELPHSPSTSSTSTPSTSDSEDQRRNPINLWIKESDIKMLKKISIGAFAKVYKGLYKTQVVAVKVLKGDLDEETIESFKKEFQILSNIKSQHLIHFHGACIEKKLSMVMEYCTLGTLYHVMKNKSEVFTWPRVVDFMYQIVMGIQCLHDNNPPILHRDLKSLNILITKDYIVKISDFGLSRFNTVSNHSSLGRLCGTMAYCPPEVYAGERFTPQSDVFSIGIILWELAYRAAFGHYKAPYSEYPFIQYDFQIIIQTAQRQLRPTVPAECPPSLGFLMTRCWHFQPEMRPLCGEILSILSAIKEELQNDPIRMEATASSNPLSPSNLETSLISISPTITPEITN